MNQTDLQKAVSIIKDCEELKTKIDGLIEIGNSLSESHLKDNFEIKIEKPKTKKEPIIDSNDDLYGESPLKGFLGNWSIEISSAGTNSDDSKDFFTEKLSVQECLVIVNSLLLINRDRLKQKIDQLKELGVNITA